ncbi:MAG TPA: SRPBCC family protein [Fibrobacteria bacterium]|nr:SRPBCC family protein [Fibrobacteria bacterium]
MKILKNIILGVVALVVLMAVIGLVAIPRESKVERSVVIAAPADVIFDQVNDLKKNEAWSPWKDPTMKLTYGPVTEGKGAQSMWTSKDMGNGTMTIEESLPSSSINIGLDFGAMGKAKAFWTFVPEGEGVKVTEVMASDAGMNPAKRWMSLMSDKMVGPYFEKGLAALKQVSESRAAEIKAEQAATQQAAAAPVEEAAPAAAPSTAAPAKAK